MDRGYFTMMILIEIAEIGTTIFYIDSGSRSPDMNKKLRKEDKGVEEEINMKALDKKYLIHK